MAIACVYCGGTHPRPADVRACWERQRAGTAGPVAEGPIISHRPDTRDDVISRSKHAASTTATPDRPAASDPNDRPGRQRLDLDRWAGPDELARGLIVADDGDVPAPWESAEHIHLDDAALDEPAPVLARLHAAAHGRRRVVVIVPPGGRGDALLDDGAAERIDVPPHELGAQFTFPFEELQHLALANAIDARDRSHPNWSTIDRAVASGARLAAGGERGDVVTPEGESVWIDGGPSGYHEPIDGVPVVSAVALQHGSLQPPRTNETTASLADDQLAAVTHPGGSARIIAPAGSGKTRVLTERARHLLTAWQLPASAVSLVAFNKRAQTEMRERTGDLPGLQVRTLNAIALAICNGTPPFAPQPTTWRTIDESEVRRIIGRLVQFPRRRNADPVAPWIEALSVVRLGLRSPERVESDDDGDVDGFAAMYPRYRAELERQRCLDFDGQIHRALEILLTQAPARHAAQHASRLLLVDEFQDLTPAHVLLVRLLGGRGGHVFGVGDDDQTIYGYNGADPAWLIDFATLFPGSGDHPLTVNYRCPGDVVTAADRLLRHNRRRVDKTIHAAPSTPGDSGDSGGAHHGLDVVTGEDPVAATADHVVRALADGQRTDEVAVLTRVNSLLAPVQAALLAQQLPIHGGVGTEFLSRTAVRAVLSWFRLALAGASGRPVAFSPEDLGEALRRPSRSLHPRIGDWVTEQRDVRGLRRLADRLNTERDADRVHDFADDIARLQTMVTAGTSTERLVRTLVDELGLGGSVSSLDNNRRGMNRAAQSDDLTAVDHLARLHTDVATFEGWLTEMLRAPRRDDGVVLATVHRVKGQEWPRVIVHCASADQFPHRLATDLEEERRLFHVAITRTSHRTTIVTGDRPSSFVDELHNEPPVRVADASDDGARRGHDVGSANATDAGGVTPTDPLIDRSIVVAAPGLVLIDGGREWIVEALDTGSESEAGPGDGTVVGVVARQGDATRRFAAGSKVVTAGNQRGVLQVSSEEALAPESVVAYDELRSLRERLRNGKPAYVVFDDKTLAAIARARPTDLDELAAIKGVGPTKLEQYGVEVLGISSFATRQQGSSG